MCTIATDDHAYSITESPRKLKEKLDKSSEQILHLKKKLKASQQGSRRLKIKVKSLKTVVKQLREKQLISSNCEEMLNQTFSGVPLEVMNRIASGKVDKS